ncbi:MAG: flagellar assembly protein FliW [Planctomycetales bacterium]|nr:flagellar assembly protein FliW [Planctomycetales bacterium]
MEVVTSRFGKLHVAPSDLVHFPQRILGLRTCRQWCLLADANSPVLGWLQSVENPEVALGVVSPRRFEPDYALRVARRDLADLELDNLQDAQVSVIVSRHVEGLAINLSAPIVINVEARRGCQVIAKDAWPVRKLLPQTSPSWRRTA